MAATYISLDSEQSQVTARYARDLRNRMEATRTNLRIYQQQLDIYVKSMEKRFNFSFNDTVPLKALELQEKRMREIADLFDRAAELAKQYDGDLASQTDMLDLAVGSMDNIGSYAGTIGVITGVLTGETSVGDGWIGVDELPTGEEIIADMQQRYDRLIAQHDKPSFAKQCSAFVYRQLADLGVITAGEDPEAKHGYQWFGNWVNKTHTSTGYQVNAYKSLEALIAAHPDEYLTNIVLSFDQKEGWYPDFSGHIVLITAIRDGYVYFMDNSTMSERTYSPEKPAVVSVADFLRYYPDANGVIHYTKYKEGAE